MQSVNRWAFKEWAAVCEALLSSRQTVILRKGGIHEGRGGFEVDQREFWLFPTRFHQTPEELKPDGLPWLERASAAAPPPGNILLPGYVVVDRVDRITEEDALAGLSGLHILSERVVADRFHYREPGLFILSVRAFRSRRPIVRDDLPAFAGCRSWVDLSEELPTDGLEPVVVDARR